MKTVFRGKDLDEDDEGKTVEVWTAFGDCGFAFQTGETYLVYADDDEESDVMTTGALYAHPPRLRCRRRPRLPLFLQEFTAIAPARIEGFVTADLLYQRQLDIVRYPDRITSPVAGVIVELKSQAPARYATTDERGRARVRRPRRR